MKMEQLDFYPAARKIWNTFYPSAQPLQPRVNFLYCTKNNNTPWNLLTRHTLPKENLLARPGVPILRYLFPKNFKKSQHFFNIQRIQPIPSSQRNPHNPHNQTLDQHGNKPVFLVEGFFACIHIVKAGFEAVSLMGTTVFSYQLDMQPDELSLDYLKRIMNEPTLC